MIKPRSSVTQAGDEFRLTGDLEDLSFGLNDVNGQKDAVKAWNAGEKKVLAALTGRTEDTALAMNELQAAVGMSESTLRRVVRTLMQSDEIRRIKQKSEGGRPGYVYLA